MSARKARVADAFGRARDYDRHAAIQRQVAGRLAARIASLPLPQRPRVLEIGCGTGFLAEALSGWRSQPDWLMTDIAAAMLDRCRQRFGSEGRWRFAVVDGEHPELPAAEAPFDLVCASLAVQWFDDLGRGLGRLLRLLRPGGHLCFSTLADGSFAEWRSAHADLGLLHGMRDYPTAAELRSLRLDGQAGEYQFDWLVQPHADSRDFLHTLRAIGAGTPAGEHRPLGPLAMRQVMRQFEAGGAVARYHVALGTYTKA